MADSKRDELSRLRERVTQLEAKNAQLEAEKAQLEDEKAQLEDEKAQLEDEKAELARQLRARDLAALSRRASRDNAPRDAARRRWLGWVREHFPEDMARLERKAKRSKNDLWDLANGDKKLATAKAARRLEKRRLDQQRRRETEPGRREADQARRDLKQATLALFKKKRPETPC